MAGDPEFRRAIEEIKLRAPIESIVGETVELKQKGRDLWGCCPFHEERTPSFKVDPRAGSWYCFGACRKGGDVIAFVQERGQMTFMDALSLLSAQTGVDLPRTKPLRTRENDPGLAALSFAESMFREELTRPEGREAREYLKSRGFDQNVIEAFGLGWAPRSGQVLIERAKRAGVSAEALVETGLARRSDRNGDLYSFFRGRLMIPIRTERGTTVAFGGRVVGDADGPKYVNTGETSYFHKGRLIYALDRALDAVRRGGHLVLVEGYTDVMAAHAAGLPQVGAVLGTATTEAHAALVRRAGARRVSLVFDGDEAGRRAAWRGLEGLLHLDLTLEVVPMPEGEDPADLLMGPKGVEAFTARLETSLSWFDFLVETVEAKRPEGARALALEVDRALELIRRLPRPVEVDGAVVDLAGRLGIPVDTIRAQFRAMEGRRPGSSRRPRGGAEAQAAGPKPQHEGSMSGPGDGEDPVSARQKAQKAPLEARVRTAYGSLLGAALEDASLIPRLRPWIERCPAPDLAHVFQVVVDLWEHEDAEITASLVMTALEDHPARNIVPGIVEYARRADQATHLFESAVRFLERHEQEREINRLQAEIQSLDARAAADPSAARLLDDALRRLLDLQRSLS